MRTLLLQAAIRLAGQGKAPTVTEVADAAEVSRRTAYRYFPTQEQLLTEVSLERLRPQVDKAVNAALARESPAAILDAGIDAIQRIAIENEAVLRTIVRLSLDRRLGGQQTENPESFPVRGTRRVEWIEALLASARPMLAPHIFERLVSGLTLCVGIESLVTLQDVRVLSSGQSVKICRWAAQAMLDTALRESHRRRNKGPAPARKKNSAVS